MYFLKSLLSVNRQYNKNILFTVKLDKTELRLNGNLGITEHYFGPI
jgi:hypothetical protein